MTTIISSVEDLCNVFTDVYSDDVYESKECAIEAARQNLSDARLHREYDFGAKKDTQQTVICEHTSQFTGCRFWIDEDSSEKVVFISETDAAAFEYQRRGFSEYNKTAISDISLIPQKTRRYGIEINIWDRPPPTEVTIPRKLPKLPIDRGELALAIIKEFEMKVVDVDTREVYSPLRLWTKEARRDLNYSVPSTFGSRLNQYYAIKVIHRGTDPESIGESGKELIKKARERMRNEKDNIDDFWYVTCMEVYNSNGLVDV